MALTLAQLLTTRTQPEWRDWLLGKLNTLGFRATAWQSGSTPRNLVEMTAAGLADAQSAVVTIAEGGLLDTAEEGWLTLLASSAFDAHRKPATFTEGWVTLACSSAAGPYTITAGAMVVGVPSAGTAAAKRFTALEGGTLNTSGTLRLKVRAESPGAAYNVAASAITYVFTPLPGVTVSTTNNDWPPTTGVAGADEEGDTALRQRCRDKWATIGRGATAAAYRYWCTSASAGVTRVKTVSGSGDGRVYCYLAGPAGPADTGAVATANASVQTQKPLTDVALVAAASGTTVPVTGTVYVRATSFDSARVAGLAAIAAYQAVLDMGETVDLGALYAALRQPGVTDVDLLAPSGDQVIGTNALAVFDTAGLVWVSVP